MDAITRRQALSLSGLALGAAGVAVAAAPSAAAARPAAPVSRPAAPVSQPAAAVWPGPPATLDDWPQAMAGPEHGGWNRGPSALTPATVGGLRQAWSVPLTSPGADPGAAVVVGESLFVGGSTLSRRAVATGAALWSVDLGPFTSLVTTPAYWNGVVVAQVRRDARRGPVSDLLAVSAATGALLWRRQLGRLSLSSATVRAGLVHVGIGNDTVETRLLTTGRLLWTWTTATTAAYGLVSSPTTDGQTVFVSHSGGGQVVALAARTGAVLWQRELADLIGTTVDGFTTALHDGRLVVGTQGSGIFSLDAATGATLWQRPLDDSVWRAPAATDTVLVVPVGPHTDRMQGLDPTTGDVLWSYDGAPDLDGSFALAVGGRLAFASGRSRHGVWIDAVDIGTGRRRLRLPVPVDAVGLAPTVAGDALYCAFGSSAGDLTTLRRFDLTAASGA